jgi:hypothetical protein
MLSSVAVTTYDRRWQLEEFLQAWETGAFQQRVELVNGEVLAVSIGDWHGDTAMKVIRALPNHLFTVTNSSLATGQSLPDPDCWVRRRTSRPTTRLSERLSRWAADDVLLVVEVSDETRTYDLTVKATLYAAAGFAHYWVVTRDGVYAHGEPGPFGYARCVVHRRGAQVPVPYADEIALDVTALVEPSTG